MLTWVFGSPRSPSSNMSSSNESSLLSTTVSILDGLNYLVWKNRMRAWLRSKGLWQITAGNEWKFPEADANASIAVWVVMCKAWLQAVKPWLLSPRSLSWAGPCWQLGRAQGLACTQQSLSQALKLWLCTNNIDSMWCNTLTDISVCKKIYHHDCTVFQPHNCHRTAIHCK